MERFEGQVDNGPVDDRAWRRQDFLSEQAGNQRALREIRKLALKQEGEVTEPLRTTEKESRP
jgi:hypothetical protein